VPVEDNEVIFEDHNEWSKYVRENEDILSKYDL
jgi:hypothetical protein